MSRGSFQAILCQTCLSILSLSFSWLPSYCQLPSLLPRLSLCSRLYLSHSSLRRFVSLPLSLPLWLHVGDSQRSQAIALLQRFGSLPSQAMALTSATCLLRFLLIVWLLSTQTIAQGLASTTLPTLHIQSLTAYFPILSIILMAIALVLLFGK